MIPETWLPTATVVTAETDPVAVTVCVTSPRSTFAVRYFGSELFLLPSRRTTPPMIPTTTTTHTIFFMALTRTPFVARDLPRGQSLAAGLPGQNARLQKDYKRSSCVGDRSERESMRTSAAEGHRLANSREP